MAYLAILPAARAADALHERAGRLSDEAGRIEAALEQADASEVHMIEGHYLIARLRIRALYRQVGDFPVIAAISPEAQHDPQGFKKACQAARQRLAEVEE